MHIVYALPLDGADRALDTNGTLATSVLAWQKWLRGQWGLPRSASTATDRPGERLVATRHHLCSPSQTDVQMASTGGNSVVLNIEQELRSSGLINADASARKIYAVYYDGSSTFSVRRLSLAPDSRRKGRRPLLEGNATRRARPAPRSPSLRTRGHPATSSS